MADQNDDYKLALELQREFEHEFLPNNLSNTFEPTDKNSNKRKWRSNDDDDDNLNQTQNLVHPEWETLDPTPDVLALFHAFDKKFFQGRLKCVVLEWSKRMYSCAGICYSRRNRYGMAITIRLSEPLLKLRSRKDLVETLLHEMIHAYLSVLNIREGNGGHGPNFHRIMQGINKVAGTNITVYHTFLDEVDIYKTHWWRCNGVCQHRTPFFGYVKRTSNRAPSHNDFWWEQHLKSCGGSFLKVKEPEKIPKVKEKKTRKPKNTNDIRQFFNTTTGNGIATKVTDVDLTTVPEDPFFAKKTPIRTSNVVGFKDLTSQSTVRPIRSNPTPAVRSSSKIVETDMNKVRDVWAKKFTSDSKKDQPQSNSDIINLSSPGESSKFQSAVWTLIDDDLMLKEEVLSVVEINSDDDQNNDGSAENGRKPNVNLSGTCTTAHIKKEIEDSGDSSCADIIEILDGDFKDDFTGDDSIEDTSLIDDLFGEDTLLREFKMNNDVVPTNSRYLSDPNNDIISCPICHEKLPRQHFPSHLDGCVGIVETVNPLPSTSGVKKPSKKYSAKQKKIAEERTLRDAGYTSAVISSVFGNNEDDGPDVSASPETGRRAGPLDNSIHACPICAKLIHVGRINEHLDVCLLKE